MYFYCCERRYQFTMQRNPSLKYFFKIRVFPALIVQLAFFFIQSCSFLLLFFHFYILATHNNAQIRRDTKKKEEEETSAYNCRGGGEGRKYHHNAPILFERDHHIITIDRFSSIINPYRDKKVDKRAAIIAIWNQQTLTTAERSAHNLAILDSGIWHSATSASRELIRNHYHNKRFAKRKASFTENL